MASAIDTPTKRRKLTPRREPYFHKLGKGQYLGFRKAEDSGSWIARSRIDGGKQKYQSLGKEDELSFEDACKAALKWFGEIANADPELNTRYTVRDCVNDYIAHLLVEKGKDPSQRSKQTLEKHLVSALGDREMAKLTTIQLKRWRDDMVGVHDDPETARKAKNTANRVLNSVKAAFNLAFKQGLVLSDSSWRRLDSFKGVSQARTLFLTDKQITALLKQAEGGLYNLIKAAVLTGARFGELANARVVDLDLKNGSLHFSGKTGQRDCYLSNDALDFIKGISKDSLPMAYLFTDDKGCPWNKKTQNDAFREVAKAAKLPPDTVFYSLRHYHISKALLAQVPAQIVAENCGTSIRMLEKHYGKFMKTDRRRLMEAVELAK